MAHVAEIQYVSDESGDPTAVIVPIELWREILDATHLELSQPLPDRPGQQIEIVIPIAGREDVEARASDNRISSASGLRDREDAWCRSHPEILSRFADQWIVVEGEEIIAHGKNPAQLLKEARAQGVRIPYVIYVESPRPDIVKMGLW